MGKLTKKQRSYCMSHIRSSGTSIEVLFRKYLWGNGFRNYRIKNKITGRPDMFFPKKKISVFIDGCFWHRCAKCFIEPKSNKKYWTPKIQKNIERDKNVNKILKKEGITVIRFWEHEVKKDINKCYNKFKQVYEKNKNN